jgi:biopolymer transport protein ExbD
VKLHSPLPEKKTRLEIIPLIDVMFFLLASFMMVSLTMSKQQTIKVNLPVASITLPSLETELAKRFGQDPATPVYISGDVNTRFADLVKALDLVKRVGFTKVAFNVKPTGGSAAPAQP